MTATHTPRRKTRSFHHGLQWQARYGLMLISPWLIGLLLLKLVPILASLGFSFTNFHMLRPGEIEFIGFENYRRIFRDDSAFFTLISTLGIACLSIPVQLLAALGLASLLSSPRLRGKKLLRALFFMPAIIPGVAIFSIWFGFINPTTGWLNQLILSPLGAAPINANTQSGFNLLLFTMAMWSIGPSFLILLGSMSGIPEELHEAARVDGAGPLMRFISITIPLISSAILFSVIISLIAIFGGAALLDPGNPFTGGLSLFDSTIYRIMYSNNELGYAAAMAWTFFIIMILVTLALFRSANRWVFYPDQGSEERF